MNILNYIREGHRYVLSKSTKATRVRLNHDQYNTPGNAITTLVLADGDGIPDRLENNKADTVGDGKPNHQDPDDDGDGIPTKDEDLNGDGNWLNDDGDGDGIPAYLDPVESPLNGGDSDGDGLADNVECAGGPVCPDHDGQGNPDYLDTDDDDDGLPTIDEDTNQDDNPLDEDTDRDGIPNYLDTDDDGDGTPTEEEDMNDDGDFTDDDENADGIPDYLDPIANPAKLYYFPIISHIP